MTLQQAALSSTLHVLESALNPPCWTQWLADREAAIRELRQAILTTPALVIDAEKWREFQAALDRKEDRS